MRPVQREVIDTFARQRFSTQVQKIRKEMPPTVGTLEAARLLDRREFIYRGRAYAVAPIPWNLALEILDVREQFDRHNKSKKVSVPELSALFARAAHLSKKVTRPVGVVRRLLWPILPNPFRDATPYLMGRNLSFFSTCLVLDSVDVDEARPQHAPGGSSRTSQRSSADTRLGSGVTASRSPGRTS